MSHQCALFPLWYFKYEWTTLIVHYSHDGASGMSGLLSLGSSFDVDDDEDFPSSLGFLLLCKEKTKHLLID